MDSARWSRVQELFHHAVDLPQDERRTFLESACGGDDELIDQVLAMLEEDARGASLLDRDVAQVACQILDPPNPTHLPFEEFGPYRVRGLLGEGGMGVVYLAEREDLGSLVAIKILRDAWLSPSRRERFASEQRTLAQLNHPSIARLYDADSLADGTPWFVMEYVEGVSLTEYCRQRRSAIEERLQLLRSVCEAVQYAHRHAVIHRDLKPSNILVKADGGVRLLDFGIAKQMESLDAAVDQTRTGLRLMTPAYAAPEQIRGERVGIHTDVYALGVVLYELLTGRLPFDLSSRTPSEAEAIIVEQNPEKPSAVAQGDSSPTALVASKTAWADLDVLCLTAMHKDVQRRYRSVEALVRDIDHYLNGEPLEARPDTLNYRLGKFVRRNRRTVVAAATVLAVVISLVAFYTIRLRNARNEAVAEAARTQRIQRFMLNLFQGGDENVGPAENLRVITLIDRGVQEARSLDAEPVIQAELYQTLGDIYQKLGKLDQADSLLRSALERRKALFGEAHAEVGNSLVALGLLRTDQAQLEEGERLVREGLEMARRTLTPHHPVVAKATTSLGQVLEIRGKYDEAIQVLKEATRLHEAAGERNPDLVVALSELANTHFYAGHYDEAEALNLRTLAINRNLYGERHPYIADDLINLGAIQFERGHFGEAEQFYRQGLDIIRSWYGKDHHRTASALTMLGRSLVSQGKLEEAGGLMWEALRIHESVFGEVHPRVASALNELGRLAQQQKKLDEAEARFRRMADIYRTVYNDKHYYIGVALSNLAGVYVERKEYGQAEQLYRDVLQRYGETLPPGHQLVGIARVRLGRVLLRQQRYPDAETEILAGYRILNQQSSPPTRWLQFAQEDLVKLYEALQQPDNAAKYRSELEKTSKQASVTGPGK
ncbi:MAG: tetratricopeptide repeat protein [Acidobacteriota bacterium]